MEKPPLVPAPRSDLYWSFQTARCSQLIQEGWGRKGTALFLVPAPLQLIPDNDVAVVVVGGGDVVVWLNTCVVVYLRGYEVAWCSGGVVHGVLWRGA